MLIFHKMSEIITDDVILDISNKLAAKGNAIFLKLEALNPCSSIKLKTARHLVDAVMKNSAEKTSRLIDSSSGNLRLVLIHR